MRANVNGIEIHYDRRGSGTPLLLVHGFSGCGADWLPFLGRFAVDRDFILPDLRGHGRSSPIAGTFTFRSFYPVQLAVDMYTAIPRSALWVVPNAGHGPIAGALAEPFAAAAREFLQRNQ